MEKMIAKVVGSGLNVAAQAAASVAKVFIGSAKMPAELKK